MSISLFIQMNTRVFVYLNTCVRMIMVNVCKGLNGNKAGQNDPNAQTISATQTYTPTTR